MEAMLPSAGPAHMNSGTCMRVFAVGRLAPASSGMLVVLALAALVPAAARRRATSKPPVGPSVR